MGWFKKSLLSVLSSSSGNIIFPLLNNREVNTCCLPIFNGTIAALNYILTICLFLQTIRKVLPCIAESRLINRIGLVL